MNGFLRMNGFFQRLGPILLCWFDPGFYRWGGDLLDPDHPQEEGSEHAKGFGLDCSGFAASARTLGRGDRGSRKGTLNRFGADTRDFLRLGRAVRTVAKGTAPTDDKVARLQAGDVVGRTGHVGIIDRINGEACSLESRGALLPRYGYLPPRAGPALQLFAERGDVTVRRSLPDEH